MRIDRVIARLHRWTPARWRNHFLAYSIGAMTAMDDELRTIEVPTITVQQLLEAMGREEAEA